MEVLHFDDLRLIESLFWKYDNANLVINAWWELGNELLVRYNKLWKYNIKERKREKIEYPAWWLKELIRYNNLKPQPEEKKE